MAPLNNPTILLADDHAVVRMGYRLLLEGAGATVVAEASSGEEALNLWAHHNPTLLVMDISMPGMGGLAALDRLCRRQPEARVLMLSAHADAQLPQRALKAGALGYLCKRSEPAEFLRAVGLTANGQRYVDPALAPALALGAGDAPTAVLSEKEFAVFMQLARGRSVNDVAEDFHLSPNTVGTHLYRIKQKLDLRNGAEITLMALRQGLLEA